VKISQPAVSKFCRLLVAAGLPLIFAIGSAAFAQAPPAERTFNAPKARVDKALQDLHASESGRLPILDGFVDSTDPLDRYERGFYQCSVQSTATANGGTTVRISAKITAWYADPNPARAGYRSLPSNGRVESDLLDRLEAALGAKSAQPAAAASPGSARSAKPAPPAATAPPAAAPVQPKSSTPKPDAAPESTDAPIAGLDLDAIRKRREAAEAQMQQLNSQVQNLTQIKQSQSHPDDIAAVRTAGTKILAKPQQDAEVLMTADAQDEFPILDIQGAWVHVQISGPSRGWVRKTQLEMPDAFSGGGKSGDSAPASGPIFKVTKEDIGPFAGEWAVLRGQTVKIVWVTPITSPTQETSAEEKRDFAKPLFLKAYREVSSGGANVSNVAGVVVVFDSIDGGQAAATLGDLKQLHDGTMSDKKFWQECSLDPPESFQDPKND